MRTLIEKMVDVAPGSALAEALASRVSLMDLSQAAHDAVLKPREPGGLSHGERAALACRICRQAKDAVLAAHYADLIGEGDQALTAVADPEQRPADARRLALVAHSDLVTLNPRHASKSAIVTLRDAGLTDPDIVRLSELIAFVNYQLRVVAGLRLMKAAA